MFAKFVQYFSLAINVIGAAKPVASEFQSGAVQQGVSDSITLASAAAQQLLGDPAQQQEEATAAALAQAAIPALVSLFQKHAAAAATPSN